MWPGLLLILGGLLLVLAVVLWPEAEEVWHMDCEDCEWSATLSGARASERLAAVFAGTHWNRTAHLVKLTEEKRR